MREHEEVIGIVSFEIETSFLLSFFGQILGTEKLSDNDTFLSLEPPSTSTNLLILTS